MNYIMKRIAVAGIIMFSVIGSCTRAFGQTVKVSLDFQMYDVVYLTDFVDIKSQQLNPNISGISLSLSTTSSVQELWVCIYVEMHVQLRGESDQELMHTYTNNFDMIKYPLLTASNFAKGGNSNVYLREGADTYVENSALRKRLEDMASKNPTAPPGTYTIIMNVLTATSNRSYDRGVPTNSKTLGSTTRTVTVQFSTPAEAFVEITDPKNGSFFNNLAPTFNWTSSVPVKVSVYEVLTNQHSPQDALNAGNPNLVRTSYGNPPDFTGTSLTYPANAQRNLEQNKAYVLMVEGKVATNRGDIFRQSLPVTFRITDDKVGQILDNFLNAFSGSASATYTALRSDPSNWVAWPQYGSITLDGNILSETDLQSLVNDLSSRPDLKIQLGVENQ